MSDQEKRYFILCQQQSALLCAGTLWKRANRRDKEKLGSVQCQGVDLKEEICIFPYHSVKSLTPMECNLLYGVSDYKRRVEIIQDDLWLEEAICLDVGDKVEVRARTAVPNVKILLGTIRYKGSLPDYPGHHFGIDLLPQFHGQGSTDGIFRKKRLFICKPNCGLFVNMYKVRCLPQDREKLLSRPLNYPQKLLGATGKTNHLSKSPSDQGNKPKIRPLTDINVPTDALISPGERVVWYSDEGPEPGVVKKVIFLPHEDLKGEQLVACVELDNPKGTGTGCYNGEKIFDAKRNHASFIPLVGLVREKDLYDTSEPTLLQIQHSPATMTSELRNVESGISQDLIASCITSDSSPQNSKTDNYLEMDGGTVDPLPPRRKRSPLRSSGMGDTSVKQHVSTQSRHVPDSSTPGHNLEVDSFKPLEVTDATKAPSYCSDGPSEDLTVGSKAEVLDPPHYGVIRWIGSHPDIQHLLAGLEMENESVRYTDGTFKDKRFFNCPPKKAFFIYHHNVRPDKRGKPPGKERRRHNFGPKDSPPVDGVIAPPEHVEDLSAYCGRFVGIQGYYNSCYLDATLFAMFSFTTAYDQILHCPLKNSKSSEVQKHLKVMIVNPLRRHQYVRADKIMTLRIMLSKMVDMEGITSQEKDPEEFLTMLFRDVLMVEPFLNFSSGQNSYFLQLFLEHDVTIQVPTVQQLMERTCMQSGIKLSQTPSVLVLQMPRFGSSFKMYDVIFPSPQLDITDILEFAPRQCGICGSLAEYECLDCFSHLGDGLDKTAFCGECAHRMHRRSDRANHKPRQIRVLDDYLQFVEATKRKGSNGSYEGIIRREIMDLAAVVCIKTSHYVAFVRAGSGPDAQWLFFDSMADRYGDGLHGYNIPEVKHCPEVLDWLRQNPGSIQGLAAKEVRKKLPELRNRFMCDAYLCFYQNADSMMYQ